MTAETLPIRSQNLRTAAGQTLVLFALAGIVFYPVLKAMFEYALWYPQSTHAFAAPILILLVFLQRRHLVEMSLRRGSAWGLAFILFSVAIYFFAQWPLNYALIRRTAIAPAAAGIVLVVGGWRVLLRCLPLFLLMLIALPTGTRYYAFLIIKPETATLEAVRTTLDLLPGVVVDLAGLDLTYTKGATTGTIALGASYRGASLFLSFLTIIVFMTFIRIRPWWQVVTMAVLSIPMVLVCNFIRLLIWGLVTVYGGFGPLSGVPQGTAIVLSLVIAYLLTILALGAMQKIVVPESANGDGA